MADQRGNIAQFTTGDGVPLDTGKGAEAANILSRSASIEGGLYKQAGQDYARAGESLGEAVNQHEYMTEVSHGAAASAAMFNNKMEEWRQAATKPGAVNDPDLQKRFMDSLETDLDQYQNAFSTTRGQEWALRQADNMRQEFYHTTSADVSNLAGEQRKQDAVTVMNQYGAGIQKDPMSFEYASKSFSAYIDGIKESGNLTVEQSSKLDAMKQDANNEFAKLQIKTYADQGKFNVANHLLTSGIHDSDLKPEERSQLTGYIAAQKVAREVQAMQEREQQQYKITQVNEQTTRNIFTDMAQGNIVSATTAFSAKGLSPQQRTDFIATEKSNPGILMLPRAWLTSTSYGPGFAQTAEAIQRGESVTPAGLTKGVRMYMTDPQQAITPAGAARLQEIQDKMKTPNGAYEVQMQNTVLSDLQGRLMPGGEYANDPKGKQIYANMQNSFYAMWDSEIKSGKTPAQLADPDSKDYIGNAFATLKRQPAQALSDIVNAKPLAPRPVILKPAERDIEYLKNNPTKAAAFDATFGKGAAEKALGK